MGTGVPPICSGYAWRVLRRRNRNKCNALSLVEFQAYSKRWEELANPTTWDSWRNLGTRSGFAFPIWYDLFCGHQIACNILARGESNLGSPRVGGDPG
jgi:hypothetical protein